jgi:hypothetical protein
VKKVICFSLWGNNERYTHGALQNIELAKEVYSDWVCRFYIGSSTPPDIVSAIKQESNTEVFEMTDPGNWTGMFWRFAAASDPSVDVMLSRDCDSRLWYRESLAVEEWLASDKSFHIMRDHQYHGIPILGGMWGTRGDKLSNMTSLIENYNKGDFWQVDQNFLTEAIYPLVKEDCFVHDEFFEKKPFPVKRDPKHFVGQAYAGCGKILDDQETFQDFVERCRDEKNTC